MLVLLLLGVGTLLELFRITKNPAICCFAGFSASKCFDGYFIRNFALHTEVHLEAGLVLQEEQRGGGHPPYLL